MNRFISAKPLLAAAVAIGALAAASVAHARTDVQFYVGVQAPYGYVQPAPVYVQPQPVYVQQQPVYVQPGHHQTYQRRGAWGDYDRDGVPNAYDRHPTVPDGRAVHRAGWGDYDRDGVPNRYDRAPRNPYYR